VSINSGKDMCPVAAVNQDSPLRVKGGAFHSHSRREEGKQDILHGALPAGIRPDGLKGVCYGLYGAIWVGLTFPPQG
jgi:hypothetical protein